MKVDTVMVMNVVKPGSLMIRHLNVNLTFAVKPYDSLYRYKSKHLP